MHANDNKSWNRNKNRDGIVTGNKDTGKDTYKTEDKGIAYPKEENPECVAQPGRKKSWLEIV